MMFMDYVRFLSWISGKMDQMRKIWAIAGVFCSGEETPSNGKGSPRRNEAEREGWPGLGFVVMKLSFAVVKSFVVAKPLFTAWKIVVFCSVSFFRCSKDSSIEQMKTLYPMDSSIRSTSASSMWANLMPL